MPEHAGNQLTPAGTVAALYSAISAGHADRVAELAAIAFADDIWVEMPASLPYGGRIQGARRLGRMFQSMAAEPGPLGPRNLRLDRVVDGGNCVAARISFDYVTGSGMTIAGGAIEEWTFREDLAQEIRAYYADTAALV